MLDWFGRIFRWVGGAVLPMILRPTSPSGLAWFLHIVLVVGGLVGIYFAQTSLGVTVNVGGPGWLRPFWLPILALLAYLLVWCAAWLWSLLAPAPVSTDFPDIDEAWDECLKSLDKAGIGIADAPVYLVLGEHKSGHDVLFKSLPHGLTVAGGSASDAPVRIFANRDGVYVVVPGAGALAADKHGGFVSEAPADDEMILDLVSASIGLDAGASIGLDRSVAMSMGASLGMSMGGGGLGEVQQIIRRAREEHRPLTDDEKESVRKLSAPPEPVRGKAKTATGGSILQNPAAVEEAAARLGHVCGRIAEARWPACPINGAVLCVPTAATDRDEAAQQWGLVAREDLATLEAACKMRFPTYALVGDLEDLPGGKTFFDTFAGEKGSQRFGKAFPLGPDVEPERAGDAIENAVGWVFGRLVPFWAFKLMRLDPQDPDQSHAKNGELVRFLAEVRRRGPHLCRLLSRAVCVNPDTVPVFAGCYLSAVVTSKPDEATFAKEFFKKVDSTQGSVAWTDAAFSADSGYRAATKIGYAISAAVILGVVALSGYVAFVKFGK